MKKKIEQLKKENSKSWIISTTKTMEKENRKRGTKSDDLERKEKYKAGRCMAIRQEKVTGRGVRK